MQRELARLKQQLETGRDEIRNYENNLSFFTSKSKSGNALVESLQLKIDKLKADLGTVEEKIKAVKAQIQAEAAAETAAEADE